MIPNLSKYEIIQLSLSSKEKEHQSLNRIGYHVFISWYFDSLNQLCEHSKEEVLNEFLPNFPDNDSIDSILTPPLRALHVSIKMKVAAKMWKSLVGDQHHAWCLRANQLNTRNAPGVFKKISQVLSVEGMDYNVRLSLQSDWEFLVKNTESNDHQAPTKTSFPNKPYAWEGMSSFAFTVIWIVPNELFDWSMYFWEGLQQDPKF